MSASSPPGPFLPVAIAGSGGHRPVASEVRDALGPLAPLAADGRLTDLFVTAEGRVYVDAGGGAELVAGLSLSAAQARELVVHLIALGGRHIDEAAPCCDVRLGDGLRVHGVLPPISTGGAVLSIRLPRAMPTTIAALGLPSEANAALARALASRATLLITGATGSGKTTLLSSWLSGADPRDRIVVLEDVAEARIRHPHVVSLETRQPNIEGVGGVGLDRLVREALRMRPDRLVVGECRGAEVREFLAALNTGHRGGAGTLHANGLADVAARLEAVGMLAGLTPAALARQTVSGVDLVAHLSRTPDGARAIAFGRPDMDARERLCIEPLLPEAVAPAAPPESAVSVAS